MAPAKMQKNIPIIASILCGIAIVFALFAWLDRYEYRFVEISPGVFYKARRNVWTGATCVIWMGTPAHVPPSLQPCSDDGR